VPSSPVVAVHCHLVQAVDELAAACTPAAAEDELLSVLAVSEGVARRLDQVVVNVVADLVRRGTFAERGYRNAVTAVADLLGWDRAEARRRVSAAEQVCPRTGLDGAVLPARLTATAERFAAGAASLRHVEVITRVLGCPSAQRLSPAVWSGPKPSWRRTPTSTRRRSCWSGATDWSTRSTRTAPSPTTVPRMRSTRCACSASAAGEAAR